MEDAIDRAFARRRLARLRRILAHAERDVQQLGSEAGSPRGQELTRDLRIIEEELARLQDIAAPAPDELDDDEDEYVELHAEIREHEESLHVADNAFTYLERALTGGPNADQHVDEDVHRAQRWLDRLRRELATSALPPDPRLAGADLVGVDLAFAARGQAALERARESVDLARRNLKAALVERRRRADLLGRRIGATRA
jgi:chromosome segregation ATPase